MARPTDRFLIASNPGRKAQTTMNRPSTLNRRRSLALRRRGLHLLGLERKFTDASTAHRRDGNLATLQHTICLKSAALLNQLTPMSAYKSTGISTSAACDLLVMHQTGLIHPGPRDAAIDLLDRMAQMTDEEKEIARLQRLDNEGPTPWEIADARRLFGHRPTGRRPIYPSAPGAKDRILRAALAWRHTADTAIRLGYMASSIVARTPDLLAAFAGSQDLSRRPTCNQARNR